MVWGVLLSLGVVVKRRRGCPSLGVLVREDLGPFALARRFLA